MFVTAVARRRVGRLGQSALGDAQTGVLAALSGLGPDLIGEEVLLLSAQRHPAFEEGCRGALAFFRTIFRDTGSDGPDGDPMIALLAIAKAPIQTGLIRSEHDQALLAEIWAEHVDAYLSARMNRSN
ncbi:hypothetical protein E8M01_07455 [Phreatobacter stygius]|uniref:Uncharacterized protein n=2 Tax=Phreatobacter stygius TaxID=1940610 RepID=A0A4D7ARR2_9HYPH|nr:hypothetical protein E8M01_07455 [Phreatobacter stygius]